ncbi:hypothetical protein BN1088_1433378 [Sphingobacterium sp. PM2-P1-29]|nr:hypothetical protein BN1088_1433378 [Sphingobacterium sp. PM2-P1-29]
MKKNILIDTCVLRELISPVEYSGYLKQIQFWHEEGFINVLAPPTLIQEWFKHREKEAQSIKVKLKNHTTSLKQSSLFNQVPDITDVQLNIAEKLLQSQIEALDKIICNAEILQEETAASIMWKHKKASKAPFHTKKESENDAIILFSTIIELKNQNEEELIFISSNHTDYSKIGDKSTIHPDISEEFPEINIIYYSELSKAINSLIESGLPSIKPGNNIEKPIKVFFPIDGELSLSDQLLSYFKRRFDDINYLPRRLFASHPPIIVGTLDKYIEIPFLLYTDNEDLFNLFNIEKVNKVDGDEQSNLTDPNFNEICSYLRHNMIYGIKFMSDKQIEVPNNEESVCDCEMCLYRRFNLSKVILKLNDETSDEPNLKLAKTQYLVGKYSDSISTLNKIVSISEKENKLLTFYVANYNLLLLKRHLDFNFFSKDNQLSEKISQIDIDDIKIKSSSESNIEILKYIHKGSFLNAADIKLSSILERIKAEKNDNIGGWSDNIRMFLECYFETVFFIEENFIFLDDYSEISSLTSKFVDGLFASYSSSNELNGKLDELNDAILGKLIRYGKSDDLIKFRIRYGINILNYNAGEGNRTFIMQFLSLLKSYTEILNKNLLKDHEGVFQFWQRFRKMLVNCITLSAMIKLGDSEINKIAERLFEFIKHQKHINEYEINKSISYFIKNNGSQISKITLEDYLKFSFFKENDHGQLKFAFKKLSSSTLIKIRLNHKEWNEIKSIYFTDSGRKRINEICALNSFLTNNSFKKEIKQFVLITLNEKFDSEIYYNSVLNNLISENANFSEKYDQELLEYVLKGKRPKIFPVNYYTDDKIDEYLNFCFALNKAIPNDIRESLKLLSSYYDWLLNMETYNYEVFNSEWLFVHQTKFYYTKFKKSNKLKKWMRQEAIASDNNSISKLFIQLYSRR